MLCHKTGGKNLSSGGFWDDKGTPFSIARDHRHKNGALQDYFSGAHY